MKLTNKNAFTLIELLVVITLVIIIGLWIKNNFFRAWSDKQRLEKKIYEIMWEFEEVKFDSLLWRAQKDYFVPEKRKIVFDYNNNYFSLDTYYLTWATWEKIKSRKIWRKWFSADFYCWDLNSNDTWSFYSNWEIIFEWKNIFLSGWDCSQEKYQKLEVDFRLRNFRKKMIFNTLNWNIYLK